MTQTIINLQKFHRVERKRGFQPPWYNVAVYRCDEGHEVRVRMHGNRMPPGGIRCPQCERNEEG